MLHDNQNSDPHDGCTSAAFCTSHCEVNHPSTTDVDYFLKYSYSATQCGCRCYEGCDSIHIKHTASLQVYMRNPDHSSGPTHGGRGGEIILTAGEALGANNATDVGGDLMFTGSDIRIAVGIGNFGNGGDVLVRAGETTDKDAAGGSIRLTGGASTSSDYCDSGSGESGGNISLAGAFGNA